MPQRIGNRARPQPRETLVSLVSRTAALHEIPMPTFTRELGLSLRGLLNTTPAALQRLSELFDLDVQTLNAMVSWSGKQITGQVRMVFRGETVSSRALRNPTVRGCPLCLQEDINSDDHDVYLRGDWLFRHTIVCTQHSIPLMPLWTRDLVAQRFDIARLIKTIDLPSLAQETETQAAATTGYDRWLEHRLVSGEDDTWLASQPVGHAAKFCCLLGEELARLPENREGVEAGHVAPRALGFDVASADKDQISNALLRLSGLAAGASDKPQKAFGRLYAWLSHQTRDEPECDAFRDIMREVILDVWPIAAGETLLGKTVKNRSLHSVASAADELGVGPELMKRLLVSEGFVATDDPRPATRLTVKTEKITHLQRQIAGLVGIGEMRSSMNASVAQFKALVDGGLVLPARIAVSQKRPWNPNDGQRFLKALLEGAIAMEPDQDGWEHIYKSSLRLRIPLHQIVDAVREGNVPVGKALGQTGFASILINKVSVDKVLRPNRPDAPSVAEFARTVGLHRDGGLNRLVASGEVRVTPMFNPLMAVEMDYMSEADITAFHETFTTLKLLADQVGRESRTVSAELAKEGIGRYSPDGAPYGPVYLIDDVRDWLEENSG